MIEKRASVKNDIISPMIVTPIKTRILKPPKDDLFSVIKKSISEIPEKSIFVVTSKVVSIHEGRCVLISNVTHKKDLIIEEADKHLLEPLVFEGKEIHRTIKNNILVSSAGIDESNADGYYILWPENPYASAENLYNFLRAEYGVRHVGVLLTDSMVVPLRRGTMGVALSYYGFVPLRDYRDSVDLFGRSFTFSQTNLADGLAATSVMIMGEGAESTPLATITDVPFIQFIDKPYQSSKKYSTLEVPEEEDLFGPFLKNALWKKGGGGKIIS
jgi:dihydrofolate synthase / folylpolyglutamate synthase